MVCCSTEPVQLYMNECTLYSTTITVEVVGVTFAWVCKFIKANVTGK